MRKIKVCKYQGCFNHRIDIIFTILVIHGVMYKLTDIMHLGKGQILDTPKLSFVNYEKGTYTLILPEYCGNSDLYLELHGERSIPAFITYLMIEQPFDWNAYIDYLFLKLEKIFLWK